MVPQAMNQSSVIGAALLVAYVIFVINKGELPCYLQVLGIATAAQCNTKITPSQCGASTSASPTSGGIVQQSANVGTSRTAGIIGGIGGGILGGALGGGGLGIG